jgi:hypothetical protein
VSELDIITYEEALLRAKRGAEFLDEKLYDWRERMNLADLDMGEECDCILGQYFGEYNSGRKELGLDWEEATRLGFNITEGFFDRHGDTAGDQQFAVLTSAWREVI